MKKSERITSARFSGHGHYKVTIERYGKPHTATIDDMTLIDDYKDGGIKAANDLYDAVWSRTNPNR
jgi:hypothetical protein